MKTPMCHYCGQPIPGRGLYHPNVPEGARLCSTCSARLDHIVGTAVEASRVPWKPYGVVSDETFDAAYPVVRRVISVR